MYFSILIIAVSLSSFIGCALGRYMHKRNVRKTIS